MLITNNHKTALGLNDGTLLQPGVPTPVPNWDALKKNAVIAAWVKGGILTENATTSTPSKFVPVNTAPDLGGDEKAELQAKLDALRVQYNKRNGVAKLRALLTEAESNAAIENAGDDTPNGTSALNFQD